MEKETGGQAFSGASDGCKDGSPIYTQQSGGMTLRDYFAAKAMPSILEQMDVCNGNELKNSAWIAYQMADAMLEARK